MVERTGLLEEAPSNASAVRTFVSAGARISGISQTCSSHALAGYLDLKTQTRLSIGSVLSFVRISSSIWLLLSERVQCFNTFIQGKKFNCASLQ